MLVVDGIDVSYGHVHALRDVSLSVSPGEIVGLFGANGAGKTTTLRGISGLVPVPSGRISFEDHALTELTPEQTAALGIAHIPERRGIFGSLAVWQNLKMGGYAQRLRPAILAERIDEVLSQFPVLRERLGQAAGTLSGGEQQMLAIGRALVAKPRLMLLDEPSHGLAPNVVEHVFDLLAGLRSTGMGMLIVEQYASVALEVVERGYVLEKGRVAIAGTAAELAGDWARLAGAYLGT